MVNADYIEWLCISYVRAVNMGLAGDYWRFQLHRELLKRAWLDEDWLQEVLHNLDVYIGYTGDFSKEEEDGKKLFSLIREKCKEKVGDMMTSEDKEFLIRMGFEDWRDWVELWAEDMEFDEAGCPLIKGGQGDEDKVGKDNSQEVVQSL